MDDKSFIKKISITSEYIPSLLGISFWKKDDAVVIINSLNKYINNNILSNPELYWDNIPMKLLKELKVKIKNLSIYDGYEIDNIEDLYFLTNKLIKNRG